MLTRATPACTARHAVNDTQELAQAPFLMLPHDRISEFNLVPRGSSSPLQRGSVSFCFVGSACTTCWRGVHPRRVVNADTAGDWLKLAGKVSATASAYLTSLAHGHRGQGVPLAPMPWHQLQTAAPTQGGAVFQPHESVLDCLLGGSVPLRPTRARIESLS